MSNETGLEKLGIATGKHLNLILTTSKDPLSGIAEFQSVNGIDADSLKIALPFLDLHGIKRLTLHTSIFEAIRDRLLKRVTELGSVGDAESQGRLETLLDASFPAIKNADIRPVVLAAMAQLPKVKEEYLKVLLEDKELYAAASVEVKRQIWESHQALFGEEVQPLLAQYIHEKEAALYNLDSPRLTFFSIPPKTRRQQETLCKLVEMVGSNVKLYEMVLQFLRTLFLRTRNTHYCTLRVELLMAIHDLELNSICSKDPCHKFTWCVDACIREKEVNTSRARELQGHLDSVRKGQEFLLGDLSMVLSEPYALHTILQSLMKILHSCVNTASLPRDNPDLQLLCRMTALGLGAWEMIDSSNFKEPRLEPTFFTEFLAYMVTLMAEDQVRFFTAKIPGEAVSPPAMLSEMYAEWISKNALASMVAMYYSLQCTRMKDSSAVKTIIPTLIHCENDRANSDTFLHCLTSFLIHLKDEFQSPEFCHAVIDDFFTAAGSRERVTRHLLRLLTWVSERMDPTCREQLLADLAADQTLPDSIHTVVTALQEKAAAIEPPPPEPTPEFDDSPLMSVPAPTPAPHR